LGYFTFNNLNLVDNDAAKPTEPNKVNCWDTFTFNNSTCTWDNDGTAKPKHKKVNCWDNTFQHHLYWDDGHLTPAAPEKANCWDTFTFNNLYLG
jgi:hypothetical protein